MAQKREVAPAEAGAPADLEWLELLAYTHGCCVLHAEDTVAVEAVSDPDEDPAVLH